MWQMRWRKFLKDYDFIFNYHPSKSNVIVDALSHKSLYMSALMVRELDLIKQFRVLSLVCEVTPRSLCLGMLKLTNSVLEEIREGHKSNFGLNDHLVLINQGKKMDFRVDGNGIIKFRDRVYLPDVSELRKLILEESHKSNLSIHIRATKMYKDLKKLFWCPGMKMNVAEFVYAYLACQKSNIDHEKSYGLMQPLIILEWKWANIPMDSMTSFPNTFRGSDSIWVVVDRVTKLTHFIMIKINFPLQRWQRST